MKRRQAFTLVELMVSMALIIFMMAILSGAFVAALGVFRNLKGQGDLAEKLRATMQILQRDLAASHFDSNRRLSDPTFWNNGPPQQGFFQVYHGNAAAPGAVGSLDVLEGIDPAGIGSYRSVDHRLAFTVKLVGNDMGDFMSASPIGSGNIWIPPVPPAVGPGTPSVPQLPNGIGSVQYFGPFESRYQDPTGLNGPYNYQWAEVAWFLQPQINPTTGFPDMTVPDDKAVTPQIPLYTLYRRQRMLVPDNNLVSLKTREIGLPPKISSPGVPIMEGPTPSLAYYLEMSCWPNGGFVYFNNPTDITVPQRRLGGGNPAIFTTIAQDVATLSTQGVIPPAILPLIGSDIQLNDVVSFDVRVLPLYPTLFQGVAQTTPAPDPFVLLQPNPNITINPNMPPGYSPFTTYFNYTVPTGITAPAMVFDTWSSVSDGLAGQNYSSWMTSIPLWTKPNTPLTYNYPVGTLQSFTTPITGSGPIIRAVQITIRIWDFKTNQTRQVSIVQAM